MRRETTFAPIAIAIALVLLAAPVRAQTVRGQVVEEGGGRPIEGAMVILMGQDGNVERKGLTGIDGGFVTHADRPGPHTIRVDRIGYESLTTDPFDVPVDGVVRRVEVPVRPVELVGLDVSGSRRCALAAQQGPATVRVWEEARKALQAAAWTEHSGTYGYTLLRFERDLDVAGRPVRKDRQRFIRSAGQAPYVSLPAGRLVDEGFIHFQEDGALVYYAPDADAFLSDAFLSTHCMRVKDVRAGAIGLGFEPVAGRRLPDIRGTLWLDAASASLRRLEFTYVNRPRHRDAGTAGGHVAFGNLPNGTWVVTDWSMRLPIIATDPTRSHFSVTGYQVQGGVLWRVTGQDGTILMEAGSGTLAGAVVDSSGSPVSGAAVRLTDRTEGNADDIAGDAGTYLISGVAPGPQTIELRAPSLDTLGLDPITFAVDAVAGQITTTRLRVPGVGEILQGACAEEGPDEGHTTTILGRVLRHGSPVDGARVRARVFGPTDFPLQSTAAPPRASGTNPTWSLDPDDAHGLNTTLDDRGVFMLCGVPTGWRVRIEAFTDAGARTVKEVTIGRDDDVLVVAMNIDQTGDGH